MVNMILTEIVREMIDSFYLMRVALYVFGAMTHSNFSLKVIFEIDTRRQLASNGVWLLPIYRL